MKKEAASARSGRGGTPVAEAALTRVLIPRRRTSTVPRRRLLEFLHRHLERRLQIVVAPAGYGKTTLAAEFAHEVREQGVPACWLTLDEADQDLRSFFDHLVLSVRQRYPKFGARMNALLPGMENTTADRRAIATAFCNELATTVDDFMLLIFDDFHTVTDSVGVCEVVDFLLQLLPEGTHVLLASRQIPTKLNLARLAARLEVAGLGVADLRFRPAEAEALYRLRGNDAVGPREAKRAVDRTEGWVTGILLSMQGAETLGPAIRRRGAARDEPTYLFLAAHVFERLPARLQWFLMESAVLPALSAADCAAVLDRQDGEQLLEEVVRLGLFVEPLEEPATSGARAPVSGAASRRDATEETPGGPWLRYHQLWREFLLQRFTEEAPLRLAALRRRVSERAIVAGSPELAIDYLLAGQDWGEAARLLAELGAREFAAGRAERLLGWITQLPEEQLAVYPVLAYHAARALRRLERIEESVRTAKHAERLALDAGDSAVAALARVWQAEMIALLGRGDEAADMVEGVLKSFGRDGLTGSLAARLGREAAITLGVAGRNEQAAQQGAAALRRLRSIVDPTERAFIGATLHHTVGICVARLGNPDAAARHYAKSVTLWERLGNASQQARVLNMQGLLYQSQGAASAALAQFERALALTGETGQVSTQVAVLINLARLHREQRRFAAAQDALERVLPLARLLEERVLLAESLQEAGALALQRQDDPRELSGHLAVGGATEAIYLLESSLDAGGSTWQTGEALTLALLALAQARTRQRGEALATLERVSAVTGRARGTLADTRLRAEVAVVAAQAALAIANVEREIRALRRWARDRGRADALYVECARYAETAALLLRQRGVPPTTQKALTAVVQAAAARGAAETEAEQPRALGLRLLAPPELDDDFRLQLLGPPGLTHNGVPVRAWRTQLARQVLFYLALHAGRVVRYDTLIDALLPDTDYDRALTALRYAVFQVRRLFAPLTPLGTEKMGYRFTFEQGIGCDAVEFQRLIAEAARIEREERRATPSTRRAPEAAAVREKAVALYTGSLLEGVDEQWVLPFRMQMEQQFLSAAAALLETYAQRDRHEDAIRIAQRVVLVDPLQEHFHLAILRHCAAAGQQVAARRHFEYYRRVMHDELEQEPSEEALRLIGSLTPRMRPVGA